MSYKPKSLFRMLEDIDRHELLLPHIQRPFVWDEEQMVRLFDSLMRNYPVQTLLFWRTKEPIKARRFMQSIDRDADLSDLYDPARSVADVMKTFVLDGQQRLQTLYALFLGTLVDPHGRILETYLDVTQGCHEIDGTDLLYRLIFSAEPMALPFYRLRHLLERDAQKDAASIAYDLNDALANAITESTDERRARERQVHTNISQLRTLLREEQHFWVEELDGVANKYEYRKILDIFVRVNSGGTKLTASDLMFAALKEGWEDIEENTEQTVDMLNLEGRLQFESSFPLKCLLVANGEGAEVNEVAKFTVGHAGKDYFNGSKAYGTARKRRSRSFATSLSRTYGFSPIGWSELITHSHRSLIISTIIRSPPRVVASACGHTTTKRNY